MDLNTEQLQAVEAPLKPVLVTASAGTGKTRVLTERIIYLIEKHSISPESILAITFTKLAAQEMKKRIYSRIKDSHKIPCSIGTIHSLFGEILRRDIEKVCDKRNHDFEILNEHSQSKVLREIFRNLKLESTIHRTKIEKVRKLISYWKICKFLNKEISQDLDFDKYIDVFNEYEQVLQSKNQLDFDDVLILCFELLNRFSDICEFWTNRYKAVLIDECQDLNEVQWLLIKKLILGNNSNFFAVGDPNQCIYIFNGAKENIFDEIKNLFSDLETVDLVVNYRSAKEIVNFSNQIKKIKTKDCYSNSNRTGEILRFKNLDEAFVFVEQTSSLNSWAVLFRKKSHSKKIIESFIQRKISFRISNFYLFEDPNIEKIIKFLQIIYFDSSEPMRYLLNSKFLDVSASTKKTLSSYSCVPKKTTLLDYLVLGDEWKNEAFSSEDISNLEVFVSKIREFRALDKSNLFNVVSSVSDYLFKSESKSVVSRANLFNQWVSNFNHVSPEEFVLNIKSFAEFSKEEMASQTGEFVILSTIHKTKGLEWDNVIILEYENLLQESLLNTEDRHLSYVAVTRARNKLILIEGTPD